MLGVILIHGSALYLEELAAGGQALGAAWHLVNLLDSFSRFSVPVFLMITGRCCCLERILSPCP